MMAWKFLLCEHHSWAEEITVTTRELGGRGSGKSSKRSRCLKLKGECQVIRLEKQERTFQDEWLTHIRHWGLKVAGWLQTILQSHSHQDSIVLAQRQKYRSMEQNRKPRDKSINLWSPYLRQRRQGYTMEKRQPL